MGLRDTLSTHVFPVQARNVESGSAHCVSGSNGMCKGFGAVENLAFDRVLTLQPV